MFMHPLQPRRARMLLQMAIYYKLWFSVLFYPVSTLLLIEKIKLFTYHTSLSRALHVVSLMFLFASDVARYWLGTHGNLKQQVFHLTAFLFLSVCPLLPALLYFNFFSEHLVRFDSIVGACFIVLISWETLLALLVLKELLRQETTRFVRLREAIKLQESACSADTAIAC